MNEKREISVISVNVSELKGTIKTPVPTIELDHLGVKGDAHAGLWHRQVSMLALESIHSFQGDLGRNIECGEFGENITSEGMLLFHCHPLDRFSNHDIELEVTQIGKKCHGDGCEIFQKVGSCVMPKEGIFCRVIKGGKLEPGSKLVYHPKEYKIAVITLSDRASSGVYEDLSGPALTKSISEFYSAQDKPFSVDNSLIPDSEQVLKATVDSYVQEDYDLIFTTGGTGIGHKDITPDVLRSLFDKEIPGIMDFIRMKFGAQKPQALISRSVAGVIGNTLVFALPGSVRAVNEYVGEITPHLNHLFLMLNNIDSH
jgi:molybdopterin adenylyltransferase